jgi:hypothetical protein
MDERRRDRLRAREAGLRVVVARADERGGGDDGRDDGRHRDEHAPPA